jgi:hypothetical protein
MDDGIAIGIIRIVVLALEYIFNAFIVILVYSKMLARYQTMIVTVEVNFIGTPAFLF